MPRKIETTSALVQKDQMTAGFGSIIHLELVFHELIIQN